MTDEERIEMYFKFGLVDWNSEQNNCRTRKQKPAFWLTMAVKKLLTGIKMIK